LWCWKTIVLTLRKNDLEVFHKSKKMFSFEILVLGRFMTQDRNLSYLLLAFNYYLYSRKMCQKRAFLTLSEKDEPELIQAHPSFSNQSN